MARRGRYGGGSAAGERRRVAARRRASDGEDVAAPSAGSLSAGGRGRDEPEADPGERARGIALRLLAVRPRTRAELATALSRRGIPEDVTETVLERFSEVGMIDDAAFAEAWVSSRHHGRGLARRALGHELRRKGVDGATVKDALGQLDPDTERETALELARRRLRTLAAVPSDVAFRRLAGMLARKGYPPGVTLQVVREVLAERPDGDAQTEALEWELLGEAAEAEALSDDIARRSDTDS